MTGDEESMTDSPRLAQFQEEVARLRVKGGDVEPVRRLVGLGIALVVAGVAVAAFAVIGERGDKLAVAADYIVLAPLAVALSVAGGVLWFRHSLTRYFRYWLTRLIYEDRAQTDRLLDVLERIEKELRDRPSAR